MSLVIENASIDDARDIAGVHISSLRAAFEGQLPGQVANRLLEPLDVTQRTRGWKGWLARSKAITFVARVDRTIAGFCTLHPTRDETAAGVTGEIPALYVLPTHWRRGIGRLLCEQTMGEASTRGFAEVLLWVLESNQRARRFYHALGFRPDGKTRVFLERPDTSLHELRYRRITSSAAV